MASTIELLLLAMMGGAPQPPMWSVLATDTPSLGTTAAQPVLTFPAVAVGQYYLGGTLNYEGGANAGDRRYGPRR